MSTPPPENRRDFLIKIRTFLGAGAAVLTPAVFGLVSLLNPLRLKVTGGGFRKLASLDQLPEDGTPMRFAIFNQWRDAWTRYPRSAIGAVYLRRTGKDQVEALQTICPHLGCPILYQSAPEGGRYLCPCHQASFDLAGKRTDAASPSPRDMDTLEVEIRNRNEVWVRYETFATGTTKKVAKS